MSRPATRTARAAVAAAAPDPRVDRPRRRCAGAGRQRGHSRQLHRLRVRPVRRPDPEGHERLAEELAVPGRRHLHLRRLARLPQPAQPDPVLGVHPAQARLAPAADHARPAGVLQPQLPAVRQRRADQGQARPERQLPAGPHPGLGGGDRRGRGGEGPRHRREEHALVRHRGLRPHQPPLPRVGAVVPHGVDQPAAQARLRLRRLLQRRLRHQGPRRRTRQPAGQVRHAGPHLAGPLGRGRQHQHVVHPLGRLAPRRPGQAVHGRPLRDLGWRADQHRPQLPRPRQGLHSPRRRPTAAGCASTSRTT